MHPFTQLSATACPLPAANVDTDQLIPARFMKEPRSAGYGKFLLHDVRFDTQGAPDPEFPLNRTGMDTAKILVARRNFGAGSSREAAVYALADFGFRCIIAPSFGDIFASNAVNNGLLPATVSEQECDDLLRRLETNPGPMHVDLEREVIQHGNLTLKFSINSVWRTKLLNGWDDIDLTEAYRTDIDRFREHYVKSRTWTIPASDGDKEKWLNNRISDVKHI